MRAALAIYALRFGGWLLAKATGYSVAVTVDFYDPHDTTMFRTYEP